MDPRLPDFHLRADFHDELRALRMHDPVHEFAPGEFAVTRYHDIRAVSRDPDTFCSGRGALVHDPMRETGRAMSGSRTLVHMDPPEHVRYRRLMHHAFTPRAVRPLEARVRELATSLLGAVPVGEQIDLVADVAVGLPVLVIADLLGVARSDRADFARWSDAAIEAADQTNPETLRALGELMGFLAQHVRAKRAAPGDDLVSQLVAAEVDGAPMPDPDIAVMCMMLLVAGNETTRHLISGGVHALAAQPEQWAALCDPGADLAGAVEELLRWTTPVQTFCRTATRDVELGGRALHEGDYLVLMYASGNRDDAAFGRSAERLDLRRPADPAHVAFGFGEHLCLGASLARLEARAMFDAFRSRFDAIEIAGEPEWVQSTIMHGLVRCPAVLHAR